MVGRGADLYSAVRWFLADETTQRLLHRQEAGLKMTSDPVSSRLDDLITCPAHTYPSVYTVGCNKCTSCL